MNEHIFISHATPEDNEFTIWLASRLEMMGYNVWIDKNNLLGGERFWPTIQKAVQNSSKVLLVYSKHIVTEEGVLKQGVENEIEYAKSIANGRQDYLIPLHIDDSGFNLAIGLPNINQIPFNQNWAEGFKQLVRKLEKDQVPKNNEISSSFTNWYESAYITDCQIENKKEVYYTSWWTIKEMPQKFYMYQFTNKTQAKAVYETNKNIPIALLSNIISSFDGQLSYIVTRDDSCYEVSPQHVFEYSISDILFGFDADHFPSHRDVENHFKDFIRMTICRLLYRNGLKSTELSGKKKVYYYPKGDDGFPRVKFEYPNPTMSKPKRKTLGGKYKEKGSWHYGVSLKTLLFPNVGVSIKSHLVFSSDGYNIESNSSKQHAYRRNKGKNFFNEQWRDLLLAFIYSLANSQGNIEIVVTKSGEKLIMNNRPEWYWSDFGYKDPSKEMDINSVENNSVEITNEEESEE